MRLIDADALIVRLKNENVIPILKINVEEKHKQILEFEKMIKEQSTAFDLDGVIMEMEGISKDMQSEANDLASIGDYGCATKFEGMAQAYKDCVNILKSAANATNGKNGGL